MASITEDRRNEDEEPLAAWEALLLPEWRWEAFEKEDDNRYYGRVTSPLTDDMWEWGYFTQEQLKEVGAYRVDTTIGSGDELFPDGGYTCGGIADIYETEFDALHYELEEGETEEGG